MHMTVAAVFLSSGRVFSLPLFGSHGSAEGDTRLTGWLAWQDDSLDRMTHLTGWLTWQDHSWPCPLPFVLHQKAVFGWDWFCILCVGLLDRVEPCDGGHSLSSGPLLPHAEPRHHTPAERSLWPPEPQQVAGVRDDGRWVVGVWFWVQQQWMSNRRFREITGKDNLTVFSYSGRVKSPEWKWQRRRANLRHFEIIRHGPVIIYTRLPAGGTYCPICPFPASSECLTGISDAFSAFCLQVSLIFPTCSLYPQQKPAYSALHPQAWTCMYRSMLKGSYWVQSPGFPKIIYCRQHVYQNMAFWSKAAMQSVSESSIHLSFQASALFVLSSSIKSLYPKFQKTNISLSNHILTNWNIHTVQRKWRSSLPFLELSLFLNRFQFGHFPRQLRWSSQNKGLVPQVAWAQP